MPYLLIAAQGGAGPLNAPPPDWVWSVIAGVGGTLAVTSIMSLLGLWRAVSVQQVEMENFRKALVADRADAKEDIGHNSRRIDKLDELIQLHSAEITELKVITKLLQQHRR